MSSKYKMSRVQRLFTTILFPFAESIEKESRGWKVTCTCGHERSIWEMGGVRWKAAGEPKKRMPCPSCLKTTWHHIHYQKDPDDLY